MPRIGSPTAAIRAGIVCSVNASGSTVATSSHWSGAETRASGRGPHRVRRGDRAVARVLAVVDEDAHAVGHLPRRRRDRLVADSRRSTSTAIAFASRRTSGNSSSGLDRREDVQAGRAGRLRVRAQPELVQHLLDDERDLADERPLAVGRRVEVDQEVVGPLDLGHARVPRVQLDAAEVRDPGEGGGVVDDREHRRVPARELHEDLVDVLGMVRGDALLVEEVRRRRRSGSASCGTAGAEGGGAHSPATAT